MGFRSVCCCVIALLASAEGCGRIGYDGQAEVVDAGPPGKNWLDSSWQFRQQITVPATRIDEALIDFPVYLDLADMGAGFWQSVQSLGGDIRITGSDGMQELSHELVNIDPIANTGQLHFKAGDLSASSDSAFYIYYGNSAVSARGIDEAFGARSVWANGFVGVYHLEERPDADDGCGVNKACNAVSTLHLGDIGDNMNLDQQVAGHLGGSLEFDGSQDFVDMPSLSQTGFPQEQGTLSILFKFDCNVASGNESQLFDRYNPTRAHFFMRCNQDQVNKNFQMASTIGIEGYNFGESMVVSDTSWNQMTVRYDTVNERMALFQDGQMVDVERSVPGWLPTGQVFVLGGTTNGSPIGQIDETRMSDVVRSDAWIRAEFSNLSNSSSFYTIASPETQSAL